MSANPTVNRYLSSKRYDRIDHALGRPIFPLRETYRNHYATDAGGEIARKFDRSPFWQHNGTQGRMAFYAVTDTGRQALADYLAKDKRPWRAYEISFDGFTGIVPARNRRAARYACFLEASDTRSDLSFIDFVKQSTVRRVEA
jgi:hypothetical protein